MSDDLKINVGDEIPVVLTMQGPEKNGTNEYGNWYLYRITHNGEKVAFFAKDQLHAKIKDLTAGTKITLVGKNNPKGKGVVVKAVLANGATAPNTTGKITDTVILAAASSFCSKDLFSEKEFLHRTQVIADNYGTIDKYYVDGTITNAEDAIKDKFDGKEVDPSGPLPWEVND